MPAVGFNVTAGTPPFRVSSSMTVTNLSADRLDGIDSAGFMQGGGRLYQHSALVSPGASDTVITVGPGNSDESFHLVYSCPASEPANTNGLVSFFLDTPRAA